MLEQISTENVTAPIRPAVSAPEVPTLSTERQAQVTACLDHLAARAVAAEPLYNPQELRAEMQAALEQLTAAHREIGSDLDAATVAALQQLRRMYAMPVATQHAQNLTVRTTLRHRAVNLRPALLPLALFSGFYYADASQLAWKIWAHVTNLIGTGPGQVAADAYLGLRETAAVEAFYRFELFAAPLLVGLVTGLILKRKADRAVLTSLAMLAVVAILVPGFFVGLNYAGLRSDYNLPIPSPIPAIAGAPFWAMLGYAGAQVGSWLSRRGGKWAQSARRSRPSREAVRRTTVERPTVQDETTGEDRIRLACS